MDVVRDQHDEHGDSGPAQEDGAGEAALAVGGGDICAELEEADVVCLEYRVGLDGDVLELVGVVVEGVRRLGLKR